MVSFPFGLHLLPLAICNPGEKSQTHPIKESSPSWFPPSTIAWDNEVRGSFFCAVKEGEMQTIRRHKLLSAHRQKAPLMQRVLCIWCCCQRKDHQGLSTEQERGWALSEQRRKMQPLNGIWSGKLWWDIYGLSSHLWEKLRKVSNILFFGRRIPKAKVMHEWEQQMWEWEMEQEVEWGFGVFTWPFPV